MTFPVALAVFLLDRISKIAVTARMSYGQSIKILPNIFNFTFIMNDGTAFSLLKGRNAVLASFSVIAIIIIVVYVLTHRELNRAVSLPLGLILGGAIGNLFDRIKFGSIVDFIDFRIWPVFNVADSAITIGIILLGWHILMQSSKRKT